MRGSNYAPCGCWIGPWWSVSPPHRCADHSIDWGEARPIDLPPAPDQQWFPDRPISDADVERIARRVAELVKR